MPLLDFLLLLQLLCLPDLCKNMLQIVTHILQKAFFKHALATCSFRYCKKENVWFCLKTGPDVFYCLKNEQTFENNWFIPFYRTDIVVDWSHKENTFGKYVRYLMADDIGVWETEEILCGNQAEILTAEELPLQRDI